MATHKRTRSPNGYPRLRASNGRLQILVRSDGIQKCLSLNMSDSEKNKAIAKAICEKIWLDMTSNNFDVNRLKDYLPKSLQKKEKVLQIKQCNTIQDLWVSYAQYADTNLARSTVLAIIQPLSKKINNLPRYKIGKDELAFISQFEDYAPSTKRNWLARIKTAYKWAEKKGLIPSGSSELLIVPTLGKDDITPADPFESWELEIILDECLQKNLIDLHNLIQFMLFTGCRPSEAFALKVNSVSKDFSSITFSETRNVMSGEVLSRNRLKTQKKRTFAVNPTLKEILKSLIKGREKNKNAYLFTVDGKPWDSNRLDKLWRDSSNKSTKDGNGLIATLAREEKILRYRSPYSLRDTFITHAIYKGVPTQVIARWVGNSPAMIDKHYFSQLDTEIVPNLYD